MRHVSLWASPSISTDPSGKGKQLIGSDICNVPIVWCMQFLTWNIFGSPWFINCYESFRHVFSYLTMIKKYLCFYLKGASKSIPPRHQSLYVYIQETKFLKIVIFDSVIFQEFQQKQTKVEHEINHQDKRAKLLRTNRFCLF